jgi:hypothetical protein
MNQLINDFWSNFWINVLAGIALVLLGKLTLLAYRLMRLLLKMRNQYSLTGIWIGTCKLPAYPPGVEAVEIYRLVVRNEHLSFTFFNYRPDLSTVEKYEGAGISRGSIISAFYYDPAPNSRESGVFVVKQFGQKLRGFYGQYDLQANEDLAVSPKESFELKRIPVPISALVRMILGWRPYRTYAEVHALYDASVSFPRNVR